jgi:hypothetical protein
LLGPGTPDIVLFISRVGRHLPCPCDVLFASDTGNITQHGNECLLRPHQVFWSIQSAASPARSRPLDRQRQRVLTSLSRRRLSACGRSYRDAGQCQPGRRQGQADRNEAQVVRQHLRSGMHMVDAQNEVGIPSTKPPIPSPRSSPGRRNRSTSAPPSLRPGAVTYVSRTRPQPTAFGSFRRRRIASRHRGKAGLAPGV